MIIAPPPEHDIPATAGFRVARGVGRMLRSLDHAALMEFVPRRGLRVDVISLTPQGEIWIVECKSSREDFLGDQKWQNYLEWSDRFFWAVGPDFDETLLPPDHGLIRADAFGAEITRPAPLSKLAGARRGKLTREIARIAAQRLQLSQDPDCLRI